jgi:hypothetical protein
MTEEPGNIVVMLRRIDAKLGRIADGVRDLKIRQTATGEALACVNRRLDRLDVRVERIKKRLDLVDA